MLMRLSSLYISKICWKASISGLWSLEPCLNFHLLKYLKYLCENFDISISKRRPTGKSSGLFSYINYTSKTLELTLAAQGGKLYPKYVGMH